ncbi:unnamed protein product [Rhizopus stolonifer]
MQKKKKKVKINKSFWYKYICTRCASAFSSFFFSFQQSFALMNSLYLHNNIHTISLCRFLDFFSCLIRPKQTKKTAQCTITMSNVTPAYATTQLLVSNARPSLSTCTLPQRIIDLSTILQSNSKIPVSSTGIGQIKPTYQKPLLSAAHQPKQPVWTKSHIYMRGPRTNPDQLIMLSTELCMIRASKITRALKPRRSFLSRRQDVFIWGKPSPLRHGKQINK